KQCAAELFYSHEPPPFAGTRVYYSCLQYRGLVSVKLSPRSSLYQPERWCSSNLRPCITKPSTSRITRKLFPVALPNVIWLTSVRYQPLVSLALRSCSPCNPSARAVDVSPCDLVYWVGRTFRRRFRRWRFHSWAYREDAAHEIATCDDRLTFFLCGGSAKG